VSAFHAFSNENRGGFDGAGWRGVFEQSEEKTSRQVRLQQLASSPTRKVEKLDPKRFQNRQRTTLTTTDLNGFLVRVSRQVKRAERQVQLSNIPCGHVFKGVVEAAKSVKMFE
jgi:hypothetical protein